MKQQFFKWLQCSVFVFAYVYVGAQTLYTDADFAARTLDQTLAVGKTDVNAAVSQSGAATVSIPIGVPIGTNGIMPHLAIAYNSMGGNGICGYGWNLSGLSSITRVGTNSFLGGFVTNAVKVNISDNYALDGSNLMKSTGATYGTDGVTYSTEQESYSQITSYGTSAGYPNETIGGPQYFIVKTKEGLTLEYGNTADSRESCTGRTGVLAWHLNKVTDIFGNYMTYTYEVYLSTEHRLKSIEYTGTATALPLNKIAFTYQLRTDKTNANIVTGYNISEISLLKNITVTTTLLGEPSVAYKSYDLVYAEEGFSYLKDIVETGSNTATKYNKTSFKYHEPFSYLDTDKAVTTSYTKSGTFGGTFEYGTDLLPGDYNGDGVTDMAAFDWVNELQNNNIYAKIHKRYRIYIKNPIGAFIQTYTANLPAQSKVCFNTNSPEKSRAIDMNGDGRDDIISFVTVNLHRDLGNTEIDRAEIRGIVIISPNANATAVSTMYVCLNGGSGTQCIIPTGQYVSPYTSNVPFYVGDYNGDKIMDFMFMAADFSVNSATGNLQHYESYFPYIILGNKTIGDLPNTVIQKKPVEVYEYNTTFLQPNFPIYNVSRYWLTTNRQNQIHIVDHDGNGWSDIMVVYEDDDHTNSHTKIFTLYQSNNGCYPSNGINDCSTLLVKEIYNELSENSNFHFDDIIMPGNFNNDVKTDYFVIDKTHSQTLVRKIVYSLGNGMYSDLPILTNVSFGPILCLPTDTEINNAISVDDFNNDGLSDILISITDPTAGCGPDPSVRLKMFYTVSGYSWQSYGFDETIPNQQWDYAKNLLRGDWNGDGKTDILNISNNSCNITAFYPFKNERLLTKIADGMNNITQFRYADLNKSSSVGSLDTYTPSTLLAYPVFNVPPPLKVVSSVIAPTGIPAAPITTITYQYQGALTHRTYRGFLGFQRVTTTNGTTNISVESNYNCNTNKFVPYLTKQSTYLLNPNYSTQLSETNATTNLIVNYNGIFKIQIPTTTTKNFLTGASTQTDNTYDVSGNITQSIATIWNGTNVFETSNTNATGFAARGAWIPNKPDDVTTTNIRLGQTPAINKVHFNYNTDGTLLNQEDFVNVGGGVKTEYEYDIWGNTNQVKTSTTYTPIGTATPITSVRVKRSLYSETTSGACIWYVGDDTGSAETDETYEINKVFKGVTKVKKSIGAGVGAVIWTTTNVYDGMGRLKQTTLPSTVVSTTILGWDISAANNTLYYSTTSTTGAPTQKTWYDKMGRAVKTQIEERGTKIVESKTTYDARGNTATATAPYFTTDSPDLITANTYDDYNRMKTTTTGIHTTTYDYTFSTTNNTATVKVTAPNTAITEKTTDATGKLISSTDEGGTLTYTYDSRDNQTAVKLGAITVSTVEYDNKGAITKQIDKNAGTTEYQYNSYGELLYQKDSRGSVTKLEYDKFGHTTKRTAAEGITTYEYYTGYSNTTAGLGQIKKVIGLGTTQEYTYDLLGRPITGKETLADGTIAQTSTTYDIYSNALTTTYPSGLIIAQEYDTRSQLLKVKNGTAVLFDASVADATNARGKYINYKLGNGSASKKTYNEYGLPTACLAGTTNNIQNLTFVWDNATGNLTSRTDVLRSKTENFTYDKLDQLKTWQVAGGTLYTNTYATNGNIATKSDAGTYVYDANKINAVTQVNPFQNITLNTQNVFYTPFQQPDKIQENGNQTLFTYAADYARRKTVRSLNGVNKETRYFFGNYEKQIIAGTPATTNEIHYIPGGDGLCAIIVRSAGVDKTYATYADHLGTLTALINTATATDAVYQSFDPWGRRRNPTDWTFTATPTPPVWLYRGFTFHEELPTFALVNMNGRMYDPVLGRMLSPDNEVQSPEYTQSYNRYTYVFNNPLKYIDPSGETGEGWIKNEYGSIYWDKDINSQYDFDRAKGLDPSLQYNSYIGQSFDNGRAWGNQYGEGGYYHNNNSLGMSFAQQSYLANTSPGMRQIDMSWATSNDGFGIGNIQSDEDRQRQSNMMFRATGGISSVSAAEDPVFNAVALGGPSAIGRGISALGRMATMKAEGGAVANGVSGQSLGAARTAIKSWLQNAGNLERGELIRDIESAGLKNLGTPVETGMMHFGRDRLKSGLKSQLKIRLDPPHALGPHYNHMHLNYGSNHRAYDILLKLVDYGDDAAHIIIK